ncbi:NAD(P)-dependent oxidoreductase [soil metagenome]
MDAFPAFIPLAGKTVIVVGEGEAADNKARLFDGSPARVVPLSMEAGLAPGALAGAVLVFVTGDEGDCRRVAQAARAAGALVNVVDIPALGDFTTPSIVDRGRVVGAVGTDGSAPVLAVRLRQQLEALWPQRLGALAELMGEMRPLAKACFADMTRRRNWLRSLIDGPAGAAALAGETVEARRLAVESLASGAGAQVRVETVTASDADHVSESDRRTLGDADVLVVKGDVPAAILALARRDAPRFSTSEEATRSLQATGGMIVLVTAR